MPGEIIFTENLKSARYVIGETALPLTLEAIPPSGGAIDYQWQKSTDGLSWQDMGLNRDTAFFEAATEPGESAPLAILSENTVLLAISGDSGASFRLTVQGTVRVPENAAETPQWAGIGLIATGGDEMGKALTEAEAFGTFSVPVSGLAQVKVTLEEISGGAVTVYARLGGGLNAYTIGTYTPPIGDLGTVFYRVLATDTDSTPQISAYSDVAEISVVTAQAPVFLHPLPASIRYKYGDIPRPLDGTATTDDGGTITYQWYKKGENDADFAPIVGADGPIYRPTTVIFGDVQYSVQATNTLGMTAAHAWNGPTKVSVTDTQKTRTDEQADYTAQLRSGNFVKLCRIRFLQPDGSTAFALDNNPSGRYAGAFIADGTISVNLTNGRRRTASVTLSNLDGEFDYNVNKTWFGDEIALDEGIKLSDGTDFYIQQGVFVVENPQEIIRPDGRTAQYDLVDKWANLDGALFGKLEATYIVPRGTNVFEPITAILALDRGNGLPVDAVKPIYTDFYNGKTQDLPDGSKAKLTDSPYTLRVENESGTMADICLGLAEMLAAWIGYDNTGALRIDPSQNDILDGDKPLAWQFTQEDASLLGMTYKQKNTEVYNDFIVIGESVDDGPMIAARAQNLDPESDTNIALIGRKTIRYKAAGYSTKRQCEDLAVWKLKRSAALQKAVTIESVQILHLKENDLVTIVRSDKPGSPVERHLVQSFSRPLASGGTMTISAVSVQDFPVATTTEWPLKG